MIYKNMLENNIDNIIQDPDDPGVDLDAVEKAIAGNNGIGAHQDEVEDVINGMISDPVEEFAMIMYESEYNYNQIMEAIGMAELREAAMGRDLVLEAVDIKGFFAKIKDFFKNIFERLSEIVRNAIAKLNFQAKSDKKFVEENKDLIEKGFESDCWDNDEGYDVFNMNFIDRLSQISINDVDDIKKAIGRLNAMINHNDIDKTFEDLRELDKKDLTKIILKFISVDHKDYENLNDFRKKQHSEIFGTTKKLKDIINSPSYIYDTLSNNKEGEEIRTQYNKAKEEYKRIINLISKWENNATSNNVEGKDKYLASCQILTKAFKIERNANNIMFSILISAYNYKRSICRKLAHKFVAATKSTKNNDNNNDNDFYPFDKELFDKAIDEKDFIRLKSNTVSTIKYDPTFSTGMVRKLITELEEKIPEIFEDEKKLGYEERLPESQWDERYFYKMTFWFQDNFAKSRLAEIEKVGKKVFGDEKSNSTKDIKESTSIFSNIAII